MPKKIRRVVTGHNEEGKSVIISDDPSPHVLAVPGLALTDLWVTDGSPADNAGRADAADRPVVLEPPPGGTIFRIVEFPSEKSLGEHFDHKATFDAMSGSGAMDPDHPGMHKTLTVDYVIVLSGEIYVVMDEGETLLRAGDTLV